SPRRGLTSALPARSKSLCRGGERRSCLRHKGPENCEGSERHGRHPQESCGLTESFDRKARDRRAQRSADTGERADNALGQVEPPASPGDVGHHKRRQHPQHGASAWTATSSTGFPVIANASERIGTTPSPSSSNGRRPQWLALRPAQGARIATNICGTTIKTDSTSAACRPPPRASVSPASGNNEALASWKRKSELAKTMRRRSRKRAPRRILAGRVEW